MQIEETAKIDRTTVLHNSARIIHEKAMYETIGL